MIDAGYFFVDESDVDIYDVDKFLVDKFNVDKFLSKFYFGEFEVDYMFGVNNDLFYANKYDNDDN